MSLDRILKRLRGYNTHVRQTELTLGLPVGSTGRFPLKDLAELMSTVKRCVYWGIRPGCEGRRLTWETATIDHMVSIRKGGRNELKNIQLTCFSCNSSKQHTSHDEFIARYITATPLFGSALPFQSKPVRSLPKKREAQLSLLDIDIADDILWVPHFGEAAE